MIISVKSQLVASPPAAAAFEIALDDDDDLC
jgi:hypothetical protein